MRLLIAPVLFHICAFLTLATSDGYNNLEGLLTDVILTALLIPSAIALPFCLSKKRRNFRHFIKVYNIALLGIVLFQAANLTNSREHPQTSDEPSHTADESGNAITEGAIKNVTDGNFIVSIPMDWGVEGPSEQGYLVRAESPPQDLVMFISFEAAEDSFTLENYALTNELKFTNATTSTHFISHIVPCTARSTECFYQIFNTSGAEQTTWVVASLKGQQGHYKIMVSVLTDEWETYAHLQGTLSP